MSVPERIAVLAFDGISPFHLSVPCLVFGENRAELGVPGWPLAVCSERRGPLRSSAGFSLQPTHGLRTLEAAGLVIVPSWRDTTERPPEAVLRALRRAHERGARLVGLCLGAFVLAEAGLLDGRPATTHWAWAEEFARRYPRVRLQPEVLYVDDGDIVTSAGTSASLDCCLHLLRQWVGAAAANRVARRLVVAPHRAGGQAQFVDAPLPASRRGGRMAALLEWIEAHLAEPIDLDTLAARAAMSRRHFTRRFREATGTTVWQWVLQRRVARARALLEASELGIEGVAAEAGFGSAVALRKAFVASVGQPPAGYRAAFRGRVDSAVTRRE
ncbi:MAG: helix-turn-helix domain-containing protein [Piscinibacter sp.]|uniref:GlxA family transcriptional regulator n=1 Tax=Piscinibacter sp. TaxID=1903157 RepID=UPI002589BC14|nr:helix-turn-helix domain-containing protein [Piscinibacter sp.]MCW5667415.1 helix-turn-helix domain-containing protein [Piscinibacter sp.]